MIWIWPSVIQFLKPLWSRTFRDTFPSAPSMCKTWVSWILLTFLHTWCQLWCLLLWPLLQCCFQMPWCLSMFHICSMKWNSLGWSWHELFAAEWQSHVWFTDWAIYPDYWSFGGHFYGVGGAWIFPSLNIWDTDPPVHCLWPNTWLWCDLSGCNCRILHETCCWPENLCLSLVGRGRSLSLAPFCVEVQNDNFWI